MLAPRCKRWWWWGVCVCGWVGGGVVGRQVGAGVGWSVGKAVAGRLWRMRASRRLFSCGGMRPARLLWHLKGPSPRWPAAGHPLRPAASPLPPPPAHFSIVRSSTPPVRNRIWPAVVLLPASTWPMNTMLRCSLQRVVVGGKGCSLSLQLRARAPPAAAASCNQQAGLQAAQCGRTAPAVQVQAGGAHRASSLFTSSSVLRTCGRGGGGSSSKWAAANGRQQQWAAAANGRQQQQVGSSSNGQQQHSSCSQCALAWPPPHAVQAGTARGMQGRRGAAQPARAWAVTSARSGPHLGVPRLPLRLRLHQHVAVLCHRHLLHLLGNRLNRRRRCCCSSGGRGGRRSGRRGCRRCGRGGCEGGRGSSGAFCWRCMLAAGAGQGTRHSSNAAADRPASER